MSAEEVICLSSDENEQKSSKVQRKRKSFDDDGNPKAIKISKCSSSQPGCSKDFKPHLVIKTKVTIPDASEDIFQLFMKTCLEKRHDDDTKKVLQKLEKLYNKLDPSQRNNDELRLFISSCHEKITKGLSTDIYTPILELRTEINNHIQMKLVLQDEQGEEGNEIIEVSKEDMKKIRLLEKSIQECLKKIKELEEKEVDFDQESDSVYIQEDRYKKKLIQLCHMLSKISGDKVLRKLILKKKIRKKHIPDEMTGISSVDEAILNFINSNIGKINQLKYLENQSCAEHIKMPEYLDILKCIQKCNKDINLGLSKEKMSKLSKKAFQIVGNFLKKKRMDESDYYIRSFLNNENNEDPANRDVGLQQKLQKNKKEGEKKLEEIFKKYVDKQDGLAEDIAKESEDETENSTKDEDLCSEEESIEDEDNEVSFTNDNYTLDHDDVAEDPLDINDTVMNDISTPIKKDSSSPSNVLAEKVVDAQATFIKVCAFAKPPPAWGELSPKKVQQDHSLPKLEYIDLTKEREKASLPSLRKPIIAYRTSSINPMRNIIPAKRVVIVKNVINNYNVPFRDGCQSTTWLSKDKKGGNKRPFIK